MSAPNIPGLIEQMQQLKACYDRELSSHDEASMRVIEDIDPAEYIAALKLVPRVAQATTIDGETWTQVIRRDDAGTLQSVLIRRETPEGIALVARVEGARKEDEPAQLGRASLIAAAPALLDVLQELERAFGYDVNTATEIDGGDAVEFLTNLLLNRVRPALQAAIDIKYGPVTKHRGVAILRSVGGFHYQDKDGDDSQIFDDIEACKTEIDALIHADRLENEPGYAESCDDTPSVRGWWQDEIDAQRED